jgi:hypothetical protein
MYKKIKGMLNKGNYTKLMYDFDKLFIQGMNNKKPFLYIHINKINFKIFSHIL